MGCINRNEIIKSDISQQNSKDDMYKNSLREENLRKLNSLKNSNNNNNFKSNNLFYVNSNDGGSNVTSNNKNNNYQSKDNTINSLILNDYFNSKYNLIGEINNNQQNIEEYKIQLKSNLSIFRCMRKIKKNLSIRQNIEAEDNSVFEEVNILKGINHKHICQLYECITTHDNYFLIMEYCKEGSLENKLKWSIKFTENQIKYLAFQLFDAILYLNSNNYMHTDIKPINILIDEIIKNDNDEDLYNIKLLNFGAYDENLESNNTINILPYYTAPEVFDKKFDVTSDVWSIGVIIYQMFYGEVPFGGDNTEEVYSNIKKGKITQNSSASSNLRDLLDLILVKDYKKRLNVKQCLEHKWFSIGNKTPRDTNVYKNCIIEEINTDMNIIKKEEKESRNSSTKEFKENKKKLSIKNNLIEEKKSSKKLFKFSLIYDKRPNRSLYLEIGKNKNRHRVPPLFKYIILYIKYYIRIYFQKEKEINKLNNIYLKYKAENNINLFINYINNTKKRTFEKFYYEQNDLVNKYLSIIKNQINNKEELFKILMKNKKEVIENNLKKYFGKLRKSTVEEIKSIFKEGNNINLYEIQKYKMYFNEIETEMEKNKYKEIYLFLDFYKILINSINKFYSQLISNNLSTNVDSNNTNNTINGVNNKSKESIKNENSGKIIFDQNNNNRNEGEKIIQLDIVKESEKSRDIEKINNEQMIDENKDILPKDDIKSYNDDKINKNEKPENLDLNNNDNNIKNYKNDNDDNDNNIKNYKNENDDNDNNIKNYKNENDDNDNNIIKPNKLKENIYINNNSKNNYGEEEDDEDYETEERKNDKNRFDPEKFLSIIGFT